MPESVTTTGVSVPRYRFRWENLPRWLLEALTVDEGIESGSEAAALQDWYAPSRTSTSCKSPGTGYARTG